MIAGIILAAGESKRIGTPKIHLSLGNKSVIEWVLEAATSSQLNEVILVIRPGDKEIMQIGKKWSVEIVLNPEYKKGMSTTIQKGLIQLNSKDKTTEGFFIILGDQPFIDSEVLNKLICSFNKGNKEIVVPHYQGKRGNPVLFDIDWAEDFMRINGDMGGRVLINKYPEKVKKINISNSSILFDIDREEDYFKAKKYMEEREKKLGKNEIM